jgi:hypothetical protein
MADYIRGSELIKQKHMQPFQLLEIIIKGELRPLNNLGKPLPPPDVVWCQSKINKFKKRQAFYKKKINSNEANPVTATENKVETRYAVSSLQLYKQAIIDLQLEVEMFEHLFDVFSSRNSSEDINSWEGFDYEKIPSLLLDKGFQQTQDEILIDISSDKVFFCVDDEQKNPSQANLLTNKNCFFPCPPGTSWKDIRMIVDKKNVTTLFMGDDYRQVTAAELGLMCENSKEKERVFYPLFLEFARNNGVLDSSKHKFTKNFISNAKQLNKHFKKKFGITQSIYLRHYKKHWNYITAFKIFMKDYRTKEEKLEEEYFKNSNPSEADQKEYYEKRKIIEDEKTREELKNTEYNDNKSYQT